jgi:glycosyltransferase involved in cell wall biosynthesis
MIHTLGPDNPRSRELDGSQVQVVAGQKHWKFDPTLVAAIRHAVATFQPDIIHGFLPEGNLYARLAALRTGVPALNSERNDNYQLPLRYHAALRLTRGMVAGVVANSYSGSRFAQKLLGVPEERVHVIWNGIDLAALDQRLRTATIDPRMHFFKSAEVKVAALVGMVRPQKDYVLALQVAAALHRFDPQWRVLLVGDSLPQTRHYADHVKELSRNLGLEDVVVFAGLRADAVQIIRRSSVLFSTSLFEGCPNVVLEAMAAGTPAVSTEYSDIRMILPRDWQVVTGRSAADLAQAIIRADHERDEISRLQRRWIEANGTLTAAVDRLEQVYRRYANASRRHAFVM